MVNVFTARISYGGADRLDVSRMGNHKLGIVFAPSLTILKPMLSVRGLYDGLAKTFEPAYVDVLRGNMWLLYVAAYTSEMRESYRRHRAAWEEVLGRPEITFCCFCTDPAFCHRTVLARIFGTMRAKVCGERGSTNQAGAT